MLIWLLLPVLAAMILAHRQRSGLRGLGLSPNGRHKALSYGVALVGYPALVAGVLVAALLFAPDPGRVDLNATGHGVVSAMLFGLVPFGIKNVAEELIWRGYFTPRLQPTHAHGAWPVWRGHLCVGLLWAAWHVPYYLFFLPPSELASYTSLNLLPFMVSASLGMLALACLLGELRLLSGSIWPGVLLHTVANALGNPATSALLHQAPDVVPWLSPGPESALGIVFNLLLAVMLYRARSHPMWTVSVVRL